MKRIKSGIRNLFDRSLTMESYWAQLLKISSPYGKLRFICFPSFPNYENVYHPKHWDPKHLLLCVNSHMLYVVKTSESGHPLMRFRGCTTTFHLLPLDDKARASLLSLLMTVCSVALSKYYPTVISADAVPNIRDILVKHAYSMGQAFCADVYNSSEPPVGAMTETILIPPGLSDLGWVYDIALTSICIKAPTPVARYKDQANL